MISARVAPIVPLAASSAITSLDFTIIYVALPHIQSDLAVGVADAQWVASGYAVAYGALLLLGGRLGDLWGARRLMLAGLCGFGVFSVVGALAPNLGWLVAARLGQGASAAVLFPATLALVHSLYRDERQRHRAISIWAGTGSAGLVIGTLFGGFLTQIAGWRSVMWVNVPLIVIVCLLTARSIPGRSDRQPLGRVGARTWATAVSVGIATSSMCLALTRGDAWGWVSWPTALLLASATVAVVTTWLLARGDAAPLVPPRLLRQSSLRSATLLGTVFMAAFGSLYFVITLNLQSVREFEPAVAGLAMIPGSVGGVIGSALAVPLLRHHQVMRVTRMSLIAGGLGLVAVAAAISHSVPVLVTVLGVTSIAQGVAYAAIFALAAESVAPADLGVASGLVSTGQQIGSAIGLAAVALCIQMTFRATGTGVAGGLALSMVVAGVAVIVSTIAPGRRPSRMRS